MITFIKNLVVFVKFFPGLGLGLECFLSRFRILGLDFPVSVLAPENLSGLGLHVCDLD